MTLPGHAAAELHTTTVIRADMGALSQGSFSEFVGHQVAMPGLDPTYRHTLVGVDVAPDGCSARLAIVTGLLPGQELAQHLNVSVLTPEAHIRLVDAETGDTLLETTHSAPLALGDTHRVNGEHVQVVGTDWPHRHPEHGCVQAHPETGEYPHDVQEVRVRRVDPAQIERTTPV